MGDFFGEERGIKMSIRAKSKHYFEHNNLSS